MAEVSKAWMGRKLADFEPLWPAEQKIKDEMGDGRTVKVSETRPDANSPDDVKVRASFIRYLALGGCEDCRPTAKGLRISGAYVEGDGPEGAETKGLDLEGATLPGDLGLFHCYFPDMPLLRGASGSSFFFDGSKFEKGFSADRLTANGNVFLRGVEAEGAVRLLGADLGGDLSCNGAKFTCAKDADGNPGFAFAADGLTAKGDVFLRGVVAEGAVRLLGADLGGNLECNGAKFTCAKDAEGNPVGVALHLQDANVKGGFLLREQAKCIGRVDLTSAQVGVLVDDLECWPDGNQLELDGFEYGRFDGAGLASGKDRLSWLKKQPEQRLSTDFRPQPFEQLAKVFREQGHRADARQVIMEKERLQRAAARINPLRKVSIRWPLDLVLFPFRLVRDFILRWTVGYGQMPILAAGWAAVFFSVGLWFFSVAESNNALKPNSPVMLRSAEWVGCLGAQPSQLECFLATDQAKKYRKFSAFIYSLDTLLPIVEMEMQEYWIPDESEPFGKAARIYLWVQIVAGWALSLLAVAGFAGIVKSD